MQQVKGIIFDWAGTTVDFGSFAPVQAFLDTFREIGIDVKTEEIRRYMGMKKAEQLETLCTLPGIASQWEARFGSESDTKNIQWLYESFEVNLFKTLSNFTDPIDGVLDLVARLRQRGLKIGSTTGYTRQMMEVVVPCAEKKGYSPDLVVTPDEVPGGRPRPWMIWQNAMTLDLYPLSGVVKVGDTVADIQEGVNAGTWVVGVVEGGNELGLSEEEHRALSWSDSESRKGAVASRLKWAGAHFVIDRIGLLDKVLEEIDALLGKGACPCRFYGEGRRIRE